MRGTRLHGWRKIAGSYWGPPADPQFFGDVDVDAGPLLAYQDEVRRRTGVHLTATHLVARAAAHALAAEPDLNGRLRGGRWVPRESVDVFVIVMADEGRELSGVKVAGADRKSAVELAGEVRTRSALIQAGQDPDLGRAKAMLEVLPPRVLRLAMRLSAWLTIDLDRDLSRFGLPPQAFGGAMVSSVGMFGIQHAYSPLSPYYRVPFLLCVGEVSQRPVVVAGRVMARPMLTVTGTVDHRYLDGFQASRLAAHLREYLHDPAAFEPPLLPAQRAAGHDEAPWTPAPAATSAASPGRRRSRSPSTRS